ncbi:SDR family oxidoreductase [Micromonospora palomenae]|uniref:SDR family oxidoreductase n=1 Tax=Micromonospora palomenae TaxID=1461247 RepID=UPI003F8B40BA
MTSTVLVTGGTGTLGRLVVPLLRDTGHPVRVLSRHRPGPADDVDHVVGDLDTGAGIEASVAGIDVVVHCAGSAKGDAVKARTLVRAASRAGVRHLVTISLVGADRVPVTGRVDRAVQSVAIQPA